MAGAATLISNKEFNINLISEAFQKAISKKGPIHINVPFDEPLYETVDELNKFNFPLVTSSGFEKSVDFQKLTNIWNTSANKMILVGVNYPDLALQELINHFTEDKSVIILTETTSNIASENTINAIDKIIFPLTDSEFSELKPEILLTLESNP